MRFNEGDTVQLKSGGPIMTITSITADGVVCIWFDDNDKSQRELFNAATLVIADVS